MERERLFLFRAVAAERHAIGNDDVFARKRISATLLFPRCKSTAVFVFSSLISCFFFLLYLFFSVIRRRFGKRLTSPCENCDYGVTSSALSVSVSKIPCARDPDTLIVSRKTRLTGRRSGGPNEFLTNESSFFSTDYDIHHHRIRS